MNWDKAIEYCVRRKSMIEFAHILRLLRPDEPADAVKAEKTSFMDMLSSSKWAAVEQADYEAGAEIMRLQLELSRRQASPSESSTDAAKADEPASDGKDCVPLTDNYHVMPRDELFVLFAPEGYEVACKTGNAEGRHKLAFWARQLNKAVAAERAKHKNDREIADAARAYMANRWQGIPSKAEWEVLRGLIK